MPEHDLKEQEFSFRSYIFPFTIIKAIHWIIFIGFIVFFNALFNGFVLDDDWQITTNIIVHSLANFPLFFGGSTFNTGGAALLAGNYYRPIMSLYFAFIYTFFGATPFFYHLVQIILHLTNTILVFLVFKKFFSKYLSFFYPQNLAVEQLWTVTSLDLQHFYLPLLLDILF